MVRAEFYAIKALMFKTKTTQDDLSLRMGKSKTYLNRRLTGKEPFNTYDIKLIAKELDIPKENWLEYFFEEWIWAKH